MQGKRRVRSIWRFVWNRIKGYERCVWLVALAMFITYVLAHNHINLCYIQDTVNAFIDTFGKIRQFVDGWTYSIISGIVVYFLTIVLPSARRGKVVMPMILEKVRSIKDDYSDLSCRFCSADWCKDEEVIRNGVSQVMKYGAISDGKFYSFSYCQFLIRKYVIVFCNMIDEIMEHKEELLPIEYDQLAEIRYSVHHAGPSERNLNYMFVI